MLRDDIEGDPPVQPVDIDEFGLDGVSVLGALEVLETDKDGGAWRIDVDVSFSMFAVEAVRVDERLEEGTYALVRVDG